MLALAPDAASAKAAGGVAKPAKWYGRGADERAVWGECQGSGKTAYRACVDLAGPAYRCSCPSRKFPCKHALGLLLMWSDGEIVEGGPPDWVTGWLDSRQERAVRPVKTRDPKTSERRAERVASGLDEFARWLYDQVGQGLATTERASYELWDSAAGRLVDAQAGALASRVRELASIRGADWPRRLLEEYALIHLLIRAYRRDPSDPSARSRIGFTVPQDEVLAGPRVRDDWYVIGAIDEERDRVITRRVWLRGSGGRPALVLSFGAPGRALDATLVPGSTIDAELAFYPGARPLRAIVAERHGTAQRPPDGTGIDGLLAEYAAALADDPWLDRWPAVLRSVRLGEGHVIEGDRALPLDTRDPWRLLAVSGGHPLTVAGEWTPQGLIPLSAWHDEEGLVVM